MLKPGFEKWQELGEKGSDGRVFQAQRIIASANALWLYGIEFIQESEESRYGWKAETPNNPY